VITGLFVFACSALYVYATVISHVCLSVCRADCFVSRC